MSSFQLHHGSKPLLISMPHNGELIPESIQKKMTDNALNVSDTDWSMDKLYDFAQASGAYILNPCFSRYVIDLNRAPDGENLYPGQNSTELCPTTSFDLKSLYRENQTPTNADIAERISTYWQPYHEALASTLEEIKAKFGGAVLLDAHSIRSQVPRFFEGKLPDFNLGTANGVSCSSELTTVLNSLNFSPFSQVLNGRFKGGYITRHYGQPKQNIHAVQLELSQATYMNNAEDYYDDIKANNVKPQLKSLVDALIDYAEKIGR